MKRYCFKFGMNAVIMQLDVTFDLIVPKGNMLIFYGKLRTLLAKSFIENNGKLCTTLTQAKFLSSQIPLVKKQAIASGIVKPFIDGTAQVLKETLFPWPTLITINVRHNKSFKNFKSAAEVQVLEDNDEE